MTTLNYVVIILGHILWFYVGYKIGKNSKQ
jgi:hypothetical protein